MNLLYRNVIPYCGLPTLPGTLWTRWNIDPVLIAALVAVWLGVELSRRPGEGGIWAFRAGWLTAAAAWISPLCPLSVSFFAARIGQHMILILVAAPLIAASRAVPHLVRRIRLQEALLDRPILSAVLFTVLLWFWHAPGPYAATFTSSTTYWVMDLSLLGSSVWLWQSVLDPNPRSPVAAVCAAALASMQMGLLGALITFAPRAFYAPHFLTTLVWGWTPLQDQQLGGVFMWVPGILVFLVVGVVALHRLLQAAASADNALVGSRA